MLYHVISCYIMSYHVNIEEREGEGRGGKGMAGEGRGGQGRGGEDGHVVM